MIVGDNRVIHHYSAAIGTDAAFVAGPGYTVLDPKDHGGSIYGEKNVDLWCSVRCIG